VFDDIKRTIESATKDLTAERAQKIARSLLEPGARKDQVTKLAQDLMDRSRRNRDRMTAFIASEVRSQLKGMGLATRSELDALTRRVRSLEQRSGAKRTQAPGATARSKTGASRRKAAGRGSTSKAAARRSASARGRAGSRGGRGSRRAGAS
jgi:polyhydroxyalkanoate synthesis regulator phasin